MNPSVLYILICLALFVLVVLLVAASSSADDAEFDHPHLSREERERRRRLRDEGHWLRRDPKVRELCDSVSGWCQQTVKGCNENTVVTVLIVVLVLGVIYFMMSGSGSAGGCMCAENQRAAAAPAAAAPGKFVEAETYQSAPGDAARTGELEKYLATGNPLQKALAAHRLGRKV